MKQKKKNTYRIIVLMLVVMLVAALFTLTKQQTKDTSFPTQIYKVENNAKITLEAKPVTKIIDGKKLELFTYNGQFPGPLLKVKQKSKIKVKFTNNIDMPTTIHWHGLRHDNKDDGVPNVTQLPIKPGETYDYELKFPDAGMYWYHPHIREDIQQEKGLYGAILVEPAIPQGTQPDVEIPLILDDMLVEDGKLYPFSEKFSDFALMGRFGNMMLVNGEVDYLLHVKQGQVVRFYLLNAANVRPFKFAIENIPLKIIASDLSSYERSFFTDSVIIAPAERYIMDVLFDQAGTFNILNQNPMKSYTLGKIVVEAATNNQDKTLTAEEYLLTQQDIARFRLYFTKEPDFTFTLTLDMRGMVMDDMMDMHEEDTIEWEDTMFMMNQMHTNNMMEWAIQDEVTGKRNMDVMKEVKKGDVKIIRLNNTKDSEHPMQHPIHLHGQRFLVLRENGKENNNLVWKDTALIPKGSTVDLLVDFTNPGKWMMHCHIAEHLEAGMMMQFNVEENNKMA